MRYSIVEYKNINQGNSVPFGVILQTENDLLYKFDLSQERLNKIKSISEDADSETFINFEKTFKESFINPENILISDDFGQQIEVKKTDPKLLEYLNSTYQNVYQYSKPTTIEGADATKSLDNIFEIQVSRL